MTELSKLHIVEGSETHLPEDDIFANLESLRLAPDESGMIGAEEVIVSVEVRKPKAFEFVRVDPRPEMSFTTAIYQDPDRVAYFVMPNVRELLIDGCKAVLLLPAVNMRGLHFIWPLMLPDASGRRNVWHESAREAAEMAKTMWIKIVSDMAGGQYRIYRARGQLKEPTFTSKSLEDLLRLAFKGRVIDSENHPAVQRALGYVA